MSLAYDMTAPAASVPSPATTPHNLEAEQALLGAVLFDNAAYERLGDQLQARHFYEPFHGRLYAAMEDHIRKGLLAEPIVLMERFKHDPGFNELGGLRYLADLVDRAPPAANAGDYGRVIYDLALRRELIRLGGEIALDANADVEHAAKDQIEVAEQKLYSLAESGAPSTGFVDFGHALRGAVEMAAEAYSRDGGLAGLSTGLTDLDQKLGGLHPSDLMILAGRPGMGKTALATKIAFGAARALVREAQEKGPNTVPKGVAALFSLEMSADQLATRLLSEESRISGDRIRRGDISQRDFDRFVEVSREMSTIPIVIDDTPAITISALRTRCRRLKRTRGLELVVVDYLQLMRPAAGTRPESRVLEISMITQGLKAIAKELSVPVIALSQLSRAVEQREDKRPQLSDLRESGSIEQDADMVMFVYRDDYYLAQRQPKEMAFDDNGKFQDAMQKWQSDMEQAHNKAELIIAKQRHGPTGAIRLFFEAEFTRFGDLDQVHSGPDAY